MSLYYMEEKKEEKKLSSYGKVNYKKIEITIDQEIELDNTKYNINKIILNPIKAYYLTDVYYKIVLYKIEIIFTSGKHKPLDAIIPYYVSDGHTNKLRANILYPFLSINYIPSGQNGIINEAPYITEETKKSGKVKYADKDLLFKLAICNNMGMNEINSKFLETLKDEYYDNNHKFYREFVEEHKTTGLITVLKRLDNFLDFLIAISDINSIIGDISKICRPYYPIVGENPRNKFDLKCCTKILFHKVINNLENDYRRMLITFFKDKYIEYTTTKNIRYINVELEEYDITKEKFNKDSYICINGEINEEYNRNLENYEIISKLLNLYNNGKMTNCVEKPALYTLQNWNATCPLPLKHCKYLKYKMKYLKLKNQFKA